MSALVGLFVGSSTVAALLLAVSALVDASQPVTLGSARDWFVRLAPFAPGLIVTAAVVVFKWRWGSSGSFVAGAVAGIIVVYTAMFAFVVRDPLMVGSGSGSGAQSNLEDSLPRGWADNAYTPLSRFTSARLNDLAPASGVTYVDADKPSTGSRVISVNPIDDYTWSATALSSSDGICYAILVRDDPTRPWNGETRFGVLPPTVPCSAAMALPSNVTSEYWP